MVESLSLSLVQKSVLVHASSRRESGRMGKREGGYGESVQQDGRSSQRIPTDGEGIDTVRKFDQGIHAQ